MGASKTSIIFYKYLLSLHILHYFFYFLETFLISDFRLLKFKPPHKNFQTFSYSYVFYTMINYIAQIIDILNLMGQEGKKNSSSVGSSLCSCIELIIFLVIVVAIQIPMIYLAGSDVAHTDDPHPLDHVFDNQAHQDILSKLTKPKNKYMIVEGSPDSGVITFMKHFASLEKDQRTVIVRNYVEDPYEQAYVVLRYAKTLIEDQLDLEENTAKVWILFAFDKHVPHQDIDQIKSTEPDDRIIIVSKDKIKVKGFKHVKFPAITVEDLQQTLVQKMEVEEDEAQVLTHHYDNIPDIFANLNADTYSSEEHLGDYHKSVEELAEEESELVEGLCANGKASGEATEELINIGVVSYENKLYWAHDKARLNYELKAVSFCQATVVPDDVLKLINQAEESQANDEEEETEDQEVEEEGEQQGEYQEGEEEYEEEQEALEQQEDYAEEEFEEEQGEEEQEPQQQEQQEDEEVVQEFEEQAEEQVEVEEEVEEEQEELNEENADEEQEQVQEVEEEAEEQIEEEEQEKPKKNKKKNSKKSKQGKKGKKSKKHHYEQEQEEEEKPKKKSKKEKRDDKSKQEKKEKKGKKGKKSKNHEEQL